MAAIHWFVSPSNNPHRKFPITPRLIPKLLINHNSLRIQNPQFPNLPIRRMFRPLSSIKLDSFLSASEEEEDQMSDGFFEAIEELEQMKRDPADILEDMNTRLSARELQLVLVYFSQEGRDSWCALEVFDWLRRENRVDGETMELMVSIMCGWIEKMVREDCGVDDIVGLLKDMECVGLKPRFSMIEKVVSLFWEMGKKAEAVAFVEDVIKRDVEYSVDGGESNRGGAIGYLAWKMMVDGNYKDAVKLVMEFKEKGLKPEVYSYLIAMTALVKELSEFSKVLRKAKGLMNYGFMPEFDEADAELIEGYQSELLRDGVRLSDWAIQEGGSTLLGLVHERLLAMYTCAGRGLEAEQQLWHMKLAGKEPDRDLYDIVLAICASQKEVGSVQRLLTRMESMNVLPGKKTLSWLLRGYIKGGYFEDASETLIKMLNMGLQPEYLDRVAVMQGLRKIIQRSGEVEPYLKLCKRLADVDLIGPCLVYLYIDSNKLWIMKML